MENINLATAERRQKVKKSSFFSLSLLLLLCVVLAAVVVLLYVFSLRIKLSNVLSEQEKIISQLQPFDEIKTKQQILKERLQSIKEIVLVNDKLKKRLNFLFQNIPSAMSIDAVKVENDILTIKVSSRELLSFRKLLDTTLKELPKNKESGIKKIDSGSFASSESFSYSSTIIITYISGADLNE